MISDIISAVVNFVVGIIADGGYVGVAVLMAVESAAIPLPSEIIMPFAGFLVYKGIFTLFGAALAGAVGSVIGSWVIYLIALRGGRPLVEKYGRYIFISPKDLDWADNFFRRFGTTATFVGRLLPIVRTYISVPAGIAKTPFWSFTLAAFVGSFLWSYFLAYLGLKAGEHWLELHNKFRGFDVAVALIIIVLAIWYIYRHVREVKAIDKTIPKA